MAMENMVQVVCLPSPMPALAQEQPGNEKPLHEGRGFPIVVAAMARSVAQGETAQGSAQGHSEGGP